MTTENDYDITEKQVATRPESSAMRLDRPTEDALYKLYRNYFREAEDNRNWSPWTAIPWEETKPEPSPNLIEAVLDLYRDALFLPDYSARALELLRASRGRAWFITRWSYEEGKHLLILHEWLIRSGAYTDDQLKAMSDELLTAYRWEPPFPDAPAIFVDALLWEQREIEQINAIKAQAENTGDTALLTVLNLMLADENAHHEFFAAALRTIEENHAPLVEDARRRITETSFLS
jgi:acyl-[acyl-carrier-protein] desaturase